MRDILVVTISCRNMDFDTPTFRVLCLDRIQVALRSNIPSPVLVIIGTEPSKMLLTVLVILVAVRDVHLDLAAPDVPCLDEVQISATNREIAIRRISALKCARGVVFNFGKAFLVACHLHLNEACIRVLRFDKVEVVIVDGEDTVAGFTSTETARLMKIEGGIGGSTGQAMNFN